MSSTGIKAPIFHYDSSDLNFNINSSEIKKSKLDLLLKQRWKEAEKCGFLRYRLNITNQRFLGQYKFLLQLNVNRAINRRIPQNILSMDQPFDSDQFNFTKIPDREILFDLGNGDGNDIIAVNISPIEWGHSLILIDRLKGFPQKATKSSLEKSVLLLLLSGSPYLRIIFNSLCAYASVNHLHWHLYYLQHEMLLEYATITKLIGPLYILVDYPSKGFCLKYSSFKNIENFVSWTHLIINFLQEQKIAHNVYITRAKESSGQTEYNDIRLYIWARKSALGIKNTESFIPAVSELFGHILVRSEDIYDNLTEEEVIQTLDNVTSDIFYSIKAELEKLIQKEMTIKNCEDSS
ncbi:GDP-D-glucose phosphorylase 1 isoform X2 [Prorops nasuta]